MARIRTAILDFIRHRVVPARKPDQTIGGSERPYMLRWYLIPKNRVFNIYLHQFLRDDDDRALHDHPWASMSYVLETGYWEHTPDGRFWRAPGAVVFRRATARHRIALLRDEGVPETWGGMPAWTIFMTGPNVRQWGFHCQHGWVHWRDFTSQDGNSIGAGCDQSANDNSAEIIPLRRQGGSRNG
jgi:hypothetical protein